MEWEELTITSSNEVRAAVENILIEEGAAGIKNNEQDLQGQLTGVSLSGYFKSEQHIATRITIIRNKVEELRKFGLEPGKVILSLKDIKEQWSDQWEKYYHATRITRYLTIVPSWEQYRSEQSEEKVIRLNPGKAFGTGTHPTTVLALRALEDVIRGSETMIDVGTGSGVLSLAAKALGAGPIQAFDITEDALTSARQNIELNPFATGISIRRNDLLKGINTRVDLIAANVLPEGLLALLPQVPAHLKENGYFIASGIIAAKKDVLQEAILKEGLIIDQIATDGKWVSIIAHKVTDKE